MHSFFINGPADDIMAALMREEHIRKWWTKEARVMDDKGVFGWSGFGWSVELDMEQDMAARQVVWKCTKSNMQNTNGWEGTTITFFLLPDNNGTRVDFAQTGYRISPCFEVCSQGWVFFVGTSLKQYIETGNGIPYPEMQDTSAM